MALAQLESEPKPQTTPDLLPPSPGDEFWKKFLDLKDRMNKPQEGTPIHEVDPPSLGNEISLYEDEYDLATNAFNRAGPPIMMAQGPSETMSDASPEGLPATTLQAPSEKRTSEAPNGSETPFNLGLEPYYGKNSEAGPMYKALGEFAQGLIETAKTPGDVYKGKIDLSTPEGIDKAIALAVDYGIGAGATAPLRQGVGIFGGTQALQRSPMQMDRAKEALALMKKGTDADEVYSKTGILIGPDFKVRFEIPDNEARLKLENFTKDDSSYLFGKEPRYSAVGVLEKDKKLSDILDHPELFKAYPELADITVTYPGFNPFVKGWYNEETKKLALASGKEKDMLSTLLHEVQHVVQGIEGFARGSNPTQWTPRPELVKQVKEDIYTASNVLSEEIKTADIVEKFKFSEENINATTKKTPRGWETAGGSLYFTSEKEILFGAERYFQYKEGPKTYTVNGKTYTQGISKQVEALGKFIEKNYPELAEKIKTYSSVQRKISDIEEKAMADYRKTFGEAEARIVQERMDFGFRERRAESPYIGKEFKETYPEGIIEDKYLKN